MRPLRHGRQYNAAPTSMAKDCADLKKWLQERKFLSHDVINEQVCIMGNSLLRMILASIKSADPSWYAIIADETIDVSNKEQLNLTIRWVSEDYTICEDPLGLFFLPNTTANTLVAVIEDVLIRCGLPLSLCRGQGYDGAWREGGLVAQVLSGNAATLPLHCFARSLNWCHQDARRQIKMLCDALDIVREMSKLIKFSPKRAHLFSQKLFESESSTANLKTLCPTR